MKKKIEKHGLKRVTGGADGPPDAKKQSSAPRVINNNKRRG